jgi:3-deoxy-D-manno-octulosonate 8-phosphate phosphatase (KDO 8-P phosphatase)
VKLLILDIDGVLTDGTKLYGIDGKCMGKRYCDVDFTAIKRFKVAGIKVCFLSGDKTINENMAKNRKIDFHHCPRNTGKHELLAGLCEKYGTPPEDVGYVGDDIFDLPIMERVAYPFCPSNAVKELQDLCGEGVLPIDAGKGVVKVLYEYMVGQKLIKSTTEKEINNFPTAEL